jgi:hypothetical protein
MGQDIRRDKLVCLEVVPEGAGDEQLHTRVTILTDQVGGLSNRAGTAPKSGVANRPGPDADL